jgi:hypothetical protein
MSSPTPPCGIGLAAPLKAFGGNPVEERAAMTTMARREESAMHVPLQNLEVTTWLGAHRRRLVFYIKVVYLAVNFRLRLW